MTTKPVTAFHLHTPSLYSKAWKLFGFEVNFALAAGKVHTVIMGVANQHDTEAEAISYAINLTREANS